MIRRSFKINPHRLRALYFFKTVMFTKANGLTTKEVVEECRFGKMVLSMKGTGKVISLMGLEG